VNATAAGSVLVHLPVSGIAGMLLHFLRV